jgi:Rad3-related DNA helicase
MIYAPTGFGKTVLVFCARWGEVQYANRQLWLFAKTKSQLITVFLKTLKKYYSNPPADHLTVLPLITSRDLCIERSRSSCFHCPEKKRARYFKKSLLTELSPTIALGQCPSTFHGFRDIFAPYGCPSVLIRRLIPFVNIILLPQAFLEKRPLRAYLNHFLTKSEKAGFTREHREVIIDEAHHFGPSIETTITTDQLVHINSMGAFPVVQSLLNLCDGPFGRVDRPSDALPEHSSQINSFLRQRGIRRHLSQVDFQALLSLRSFLQGQAHHWIHTEEGLIQLDAYPSDIFKFLDTNFKRIILMSATFWLPQNYIQFYNLNSFDPSYKLFYVPRTQRDRYCVAYYPHHLLSSRPRHRTSFLYSFVGKLIRDVIPTVNDHTWVFLPSYDMLETLYQTLDSHFNLSYPIYREQPKNRISFLKELLHGDPSVVLAVYGGKFNEGVEIRHPTTGHSRVRLVILVGLPFPVPTIDQQFLWQYYSRRTGNRFLTNWRLKNRLIFTQVHQAIGRTVRSDLDYGTAIVLDNRLHHLRVLPYFSYCNNYNDMVTQLCSRFKRIDNLVNSYFERATQHAKSYN